MHTHCKAIRKSQYAICLPVDSIVILHTYALFDLNNCRLLVEALLMTGSDLCASAKPWDLQMQTVEVIYDEFYNQVCKP